MEITEKLLKESGIKSYSLISEKSMAPLLIVETFNYGERKFKITRIDSITLEEKIQEVIDEIKVYERNKKINKVKKHEN